MEHKENGIFYCLDITRCMFSSGNVTEKARMGRLQCTGETVVDLFAGIGYYTLPLLVHAGMPALQDMLLLLRSSHNSMLRSLPPHAFLGTHSQKMGSGKLAKTMVLRERWAWCVCRCAACVRM